MKQQPYLDDILLELKVAAFRNAVRLLEDAATLYRGRSYASAFALAVLGYEELGKAHFVSRISDNIEDNPRSEGFWYDALGSGDEFMNNHVRKQGSAVVNAPLGDSGKRAFDAVANGELDREKQQALYVELVNHQVLTPARIGQSKAYRMMKLFVETLETPGAFDWAFVRLGEEGNPRSESLAKEQLARARHAFDHCEAP